MAARKLQQEMDRVFKRITEGVQAFDGIYEKYEMSSNHSQKEKLEQDLKREIKKLQRLRDQIKTWMGSNDIKDKKVLVDQRKLIETEMERFKACEKEMKTKAYSKEGLTSSKLDPREKERQETMNFIQNMIEELDRQVESLESEQESLQGTMRKGKKDHGKAERISEIEHTLERHRWHQGKMETILRMLENNTLTVEMVNAVQDDITYYVESNQEVDFTEFEELYDELNLEDDEDFDPDAVPQPPEETSYLEDLAIDAAKEKDELKKANSDVGVVGSGSSAGTAMNSNISNNVNNTNSNNNGNSNNTSNTITAPNAPTATTNITTTTTTSAASGAVGATGINSGLNSSSSAHRSLPPSRKASTSASPSISHPSLTKQASGMASSNIAGASSSLPSNSSPSSQSAMATPPIKTSLPPGLSPLPPPPKADPPKPVISAAPTAPWAEKLGGGVAAAGAGPAMGAADHNYQNVRKDEHEFSVGGTRTKHSSPSISASSSPKPSIVTSTSSLTEFSSSAPGQESSALSSIASLVLPPGLQDLAHSFDAARQRIGLPPPIGSISKLLESSYLSCPDSFIADRPRYYHPDSPFPTPSFYPQEPLSGLDDPAILEKMDVDTLFYIFYYRQGSYQQYLSAKELKNRSWRFHKRFLTWFQRHEEPKVINNDFEQGTYRYFDFEGLWLQRRKSNFKFEYQFLEDEV